jgi:thioredoxin reductase (NADPH)
MAARAASACEVLVIGAGPAGLTAATYLARFRRDTILVDAGASRARYIPVSRNCPGFAHGVSGPGLLAELREQAARHGIRPRSGRVTKLAGAAGSFVASAGRVTLRAERVILATGVVDRLPRIAGVEAAIRRGLIRLCAVCDAYETAGRRVAVFGPAAAAVRHACYLRSFSASVAALIDAGSATPGQHARCRTCDVQLIENVQGLQVARRTLRARDRAGACFEFDALYPVLGATPNSQLARGLGARCDRAGDLIVDDHLRTSVPGLYAIGDVVEALNQIAVATGQAAIAATAIHNELPQRLF